MVFQQQRLQKADIYGRDYGAEGSILSNVPVPSLALAFLIMHELNDCGSQKEEYFLAGQKRGALVPFFQGSLSWSQ